MIRQNQGFTLIEIMVVVITIGVVASLALLNYNKLVEQSYCSNAQRNLITISFAAEAYRAKNPTYGPSMPNLAAINATLNLNINDTKFNYFFGPNTATQYSGVASRTAGGPFYAVGINKGPVNTQPTVTPDLNYCAAVIQ